VNLTGTDDIQRRRKLGFVPKVPPESTCLLYQNYKALSEIINQFLHDADEFR
jgi:hypothetical protein